MSDLTELRTLYEQIVREVELLVGDTPTTEIRSRDIDATTSLALNPADLFTNIDKLTKRLENVEVLLDTVNDIILVPGIVAGLEITVDGDSDIIITAGNGVTVSKQLLTLDYDLTLATGLPLDKGVYYVLLIADNQVVIRTAELDSALSLAKLMIQKSFSVKLFDNRENDIDGYIYSAREETFANDFKINDATKPVLHNFMTTLLASSLIGEIKLSEGLTIGNTRGTVSMSSEDIIFYNNDGDEIAKYGGYEARIGNIIIETDLIRSRNYSSGSSGFRIHEDGNIEINDLLARGTIYANAGEIGGWKIDSTRIYSDIVGDNIIIDSANIKIESSNYVPGLLGSGFHLSSDLLEVGNIAVRGMIRTAVFQKDVVSAVGGNLAVLSSDVLASDMTILDNSTLTIEGNVTFINGDILRIKSGTDDEWIEITDISSAPSYTVTRDKANLYTADNNPAWPKGAAVVNYGQSGNGGIFITSSEANAPYLSIFDHAGSPWSAISTRLRLGNLNGYLGYASDIYGIGIGAIGSNKANLTFDDTNGLRIRDNVTTKFQVDNAGNALMTAVNVRSASSGARVEILPDANTGIQVIDNASNDVFKAIVGGTDVGDVILGDYANNVGLKWDKSATSLTIKGAVDIIYKTAQTRYLYISVADYKLLNVLSANGMNTHTTYVECDTAADSAFFMIPLPYPAGCTIKDLVFDYGGNIGNGSYIEVKVYYGITGSEFLVNSKKKIIVIPISTTDYVSIDEARTPGALYWAKVELNNVAAITDVFMGHCIAEYTVTRPLF